MKALIDAQRDFFLTNATKDLSFRKAQLEKLEQLLRENEDKLNAAIYNDFKKSSFETYVTEFALLYQDIKEAKGNLKRWSARQPVKTNFLNFPAKSYQIPEPLGVCLVIGAWNYPYQLSLAPVIPALAAGNTVILKPSEIPSETSKIMSELVNSTFDPKVFKVIEGGVESTTELLEQKFDKIFFTGSTKVGQIVYEAAAKNLTPVTLEMGGKSPAFITEDSNLKMTAKRLVWAKFLNAGQTCIAPDYVLVHDSIREEFLKSIVSEIEKADYKFENDNYVQIINHKNFERLKSYISSEKIYFGGDTNASVRYIAPTVLQNISFEDEVMKEEIFGPILPVISYSNLGDAISKVKKLPKPLSCYIFTSNKKIRDKILNEVSFGGGAVNEAVMHIGNSNLPFGGVGQSGLGNYHGKAGFDAFTHYKSILDKPTWLEFPLKYAPYSPKKLKWIKWFTKL